MSKFMYVLATSAMFFVTIHTWISPDYHWIVTAIFVILFLMGIVILLTWPKDPKDPKSSKVSEKKYAVKKSNGKVVKVFKSEGAAIAYSDRKKEDLNVCLFVDHEK